jgi:uncharacterized protein YbaP (TraB family)
MKKIWLAALSLLSLTGFAQNEKALLWKISGNGLAKPSYLYGTIHITCDATLDERTKKAMADTEQLYLELDMDDPSMQAKMMSGMMMKDGKTLKSLVSEDDFKQIDDLLKEKIGFSAVMVNNMKPFIISTMILPSLLDCTMQSVEAELMKLSTEQNEPVLGLETVEDQLAAFDAIPYQVQADELVKSVRGKFASDKQELDKMYQVYASRDIDAMQEMTLASDNKITSDYSGTLLDGRNANWIPKIASAAKEKPTFFGVGAAHLGGKNGVIALLRKAGFNVEAVK